MCGKKSLLLLAVFFLPFLAFSQSYDQKKTYQVPGTTLNRLESDFLTAKKESETQKSELKMLNEQLIESKKALTEAQTQLMTASQSFESLQKKTLLDQILIGGGCLVIGLVIGHFL